MEVEVVDLPRAAVAQATPRSGSKVEQHSSLRSGSKAESPGFRHILAQLAYEHDREVAEIRRQLDDMQDSVGQHGDFRACLAGQGGSHISTKVSSKEDSPNHGEEVCLSHQVGRMVSHSKTGMSNQDADKTDSGEFSQPLGALLSHTLTNKSQQKEAWNLEGEVCLSPSHRDQGVSGHLFSNERASPSSSSALREQVLERLSGEEPVGKLPTGQSAGGLLSTSTLSHGSEIRAQDEEGGSPGLGPQKVLGAADSKGTGSKSSLGVASATLNLTSPTGPQGSQPVGQVYSLKSIWLERPSGVFAHGRTGTIRSASGTAEQLMPQMPRYGAEVARITESAEEAGHVVNPRGSLEKAQATLARFRCRDCLPTWRPSFKVQAPNSSYRLAWDACGSLLVAWDVMYIPLLVFEPPENWLIVTMHWTCLLFWTMDIGASFMTGYHEKGNVQMKRSRIAGHYFKTWFWPDVIVVVTDWMCTLMEMIVAPSRVMRSVRMARIIRVVRLVRIVKLKKNFATLEDFIHNEYVSVILHILKLFSLVVLAGHLIACAFYLIGTLTRDSYRSWITEDGFADEPWFYKYASALHWALTQFTPASMAVQPYNIYERIWAVLVLLLGMMVFSSIVSSITASVSQLRARTKEFAKQFWTLRRYLRQHCVPSRLSIRIQRYVEYTCKQRELTMNDSQVPMLMMLSDQLRNELQSCIYMNQMLHHPLFAHFNTEDQVTCQRLASGSISRKYFAQGDSVFLEGEQAHDMYFSVAGAFLYSRNEVEIQLQEDSRLSEPPLWTHWEFKGTLQSTTESSMLLVESAEFGKIVSKSPNWDTARDYAKQFMQELTQTLKSNPETLDDCFSITATQWRPQSLTSGRRQSFGVHNFARSQSGVGRVANRLGNMRLSSGLPSGFKIPSSSYFNRSETRNRLSKIMPSEGEEGE